MNKLVRDGKTFGPAKQAFKSEYFCKHEGGGPSELLDDSTKKSGDTREEEGAAAHYRSFREEEERSDLEAMAGHTRSRVIAVETNLAKCCAATTHTLAMLLCGICISIRNRYQSASDACPRLLSHRFSALFFGQPA